MQILRKSKYFFNSLTDSSGNLKCNKFAKCAAANLLQNYCSFCGSLAYFILHNICISNFCKIFCNKFCKLILILYIMYPLIAKSVANFLQISCKMCKKIFELVQKFCQIFAIFKFTYQI